MARSAPLRLGLQQRLRARRQSGRRQPLAGKAQPRVPQVAADRLRFAAISGTSAGALIASLVVSGLVQGGADLARRKLAHFWQALSRHGTLGGNALFFGEPGPFGFNLDWSSVAIALEAVGLVVSPYTNPFYTDAPAPLVVQAFPAAFPLRTSRP